MDNWQQIVSLGIVGLSLTLLVRNQIQKRKRLKLNACDSDCGCSTSAPPIKKAVEQKAEKV